MTPGEGRLDAHQNTLSAIVLLAIGCVGVGNQGKAVNRVFLNIRRSSWDSAALMALGAVFVVGGYECVRTPSNTLFKEVFGRQNLPWVLALGPVAVGLTLWVYNLVLTRLGPRWTLLATGVASGVIITGCMLAYAAGFKKIAGPFYLVREVYIVLMLEQLWSFLNSRVTREEAGKLYGPVCAVASLGAVGVGMCSDTLSQVFATWQLPLLAVAALIPTAVCFDLAFQNAGTPQPRETAQAGEPEQTFGFAQFAQYQVLIALLVIVGATQWYAAMLEVTFQKGLDTAYPDASAQNSASMTFFGYLNAVAGVLQVLAVPLVMRFVPVKAIHLAIPIANLALFAVSLASPGFATIAAAYLFFKTVDYSIFKAAKEVLYIPLPFDARYRAKEWIDGLGYRLGKGLGSVTAGVLKGGAYAVPVLGFVGLLGWAVAVAVWLWMKEQTQTQEA
jgi:ATP:ADP antiporter, AAA family